MVKGVCRAGRDIYKECQTLKHQKSKNSWVYIVHFDHPPPPLLGLIFTLTNKFAAQREGGGGVGGYQGWNFIWSVFGLYRMNQNDLLTLATPPPNFSLPKG